MPEFATAEERDKYIIDNADYFIVYKFLGAGGAEKHPLTTLDLAERAAAMLARIKGGDWIIYALKDSVQVYVKTVKAATV